MTRYALVAPDDTIHMERDESRIDLTAGVRDGYRWLPIANETDDRTTQSEYVVTEAVVETIEASRVLRSRVRRDMTQAEIDARIASQYDSMDEAQNKAILALYKICWALWTNAGGNETQLDQVLDNSPVTAEIVKNKVLR